MEASSGALSKALEVIGDKARRIKAAIVSDADVELHVNGAKATTVRATPECLDALARGYIIGEGLAASASEILSVDVNGRKAFARIERQPVDPRAPSIHECVDISCLFRDVLRSSEIASSGPDGFSHISAIFTGSGCLVTYAWDAHRQCALWKAVGKALEASISLSDTIAVCSGRISSETVMSAHRAGIRIIVSHTSPTDKAVDIASREGMTLIRFENPGKVSIYCGEGSVSGMEFFKDEGHESVMLGY